jgi:hypothetical protein
MRDGVTLRGRDWRLERVKKLGEEKNNSRKDAKAQRVAKQTKGFSFALLRVFATLREIVNFFTPSRNHFGVGGRSKILKPRERLLRCL